jgi:hypothetical protein
MPTPTCCLLWTSTCWFPIQQYFWSFVLARRLDGRTLGESTLGHSAYSVCCPNGAEKPKAGDAKGKNVLHVNTTQTGLQNGKGVRSVRQNNGRKADQSQTRWPPGHACKRAV